MTTLSASQSPRRSYNHGYNRRRETLVAYLFLSPWLFGFIVFLAGPMLASLYFSFTEYKVIAPPRWIGLANYTRMLTDDLFFKSLDVSARYTLLSVPIGIAAALAIALLLHQPIIGRGIFRLIFYLPSIISGVAVATVFAWIFNYRFGVLNYLLSFVGIAGPNWLGHPRWALWAFVIMSLWGVGGNVVIFLAALQGVPKALYEAADLDGANDSQKFWNITLPLISPAILFVAITGIIYTFQTFTQAFVLTQGGPANATLFYLYYLYKNAFTWFEMGYASALAWVLFLIIITCTMLLLRTSNQWVYYEGEERSA